MNKARKQHNALHGALILIISTALVKFIGAFFKIPLGRLIGGIGMGYYMSAYELYTPIYTIAMAGLPIAISKVVASAVSEHRFNDARSYFRVSKIAFTITGFIGFMLIALVAYPFSMYISNDMGTLFSIFVIAPSMLFCCIMACYRGYYEGLRNMYPTAVSQVVEALGKLCFGYGFAYAVIKIGTNEFERVGTVFGKVIAGTGSVAAANAYDAVLPYAAAGAIGGVTLGTLLGAIFMVVRHSIVGDGITEKEFALSPKPRRDSVNLKRLAIFALPVVLGALAQNISGLVDLVTVQRQLHTAVDISITALRDSQAGILDNIAATKIPNFLYGCYKGFAFSFYNLVPTITSVIGISALPNLATAWGEKNKVAIKMNIESVLRMTAILAAPIGLGLSALSNPVLSMFYPNQPTEVAISSQLLTWLAIAGVASGIAMPITSMLQAIDKQKIPVYNLLIGILVKLILNSVLIVIPGININGAAYSTLACYVVVLVLNIIALCRHSKVTPNIWTTLVKPIIAGILCAVAAFATNGLLEKRLEKYTQGIISYAPVFVSIAAGGIVYIIVLFSLKTVTENDIKLLPKGEIIAKVLAKLKLIG